MTYALGVIAFVVALLASVMLHEFGHFATAKHYGMKATKFFVGFGPTLWSTRRGETEYGVKAIPAGGFVKIIGMTPLEDIEAGDEDRVFYKQPPLRRFVVLVAGSVTHLVLAVVILFGVIAAFGDPINSVATLTVGSTPACVTANPDGVCAATDPKAPAFGKLHAGDRIVALNGQPLRSYDALRHRLQASAGRAVTLTFRRDGVTRTVSLTPVAIEQDGRTVGKVGIAPVVEPKDVGVLGAVPRTFTVLGGFFTSTASALGDLPHQISQILNGQPRGNGAASVVDIARVSGQVAQSHIGIGARVASLLLIIAQVNFFIGIFNLLPLLPLDGGHIAILGFEEARSRVYRRLGRRDPGRVDLLKIMPVTYAVVALFIGVSLLLVYAGIVNPIRIQ
ncbi:MAG TPA: site-2 protease family protein [Mycobacteriales bacterium]|jgi:membrane-associated protease RseP (regulator of RpoE activity)|nr:site-2 protease family protein [Mycobacteriales bacterium]